MKTAEDMISEIAEMESAERWKLVTTIKNYPDKHTEKEIDLIVNLHKELKKLKQDVEYCSSKLGVHDMYLSRLK
ncbi:hypothetical protein [Halalkalibacter krulwichiae]|uniref:Uncharacterized protein n=1 Tax=Halalkalibacter krulwichiae TaxID=199441 RepID=A0A1X9M8P4_9BACI|nr:hypothetical protein [Halalkalibacter krulwichiae]ARK29054.1 hypothetical protein BkAM31D_03870 [Halalkalibacter krulwichiae]